MRSWLLRLAAIALLLGLPPALMAERVSACSYDAPPPPVEALEEADAVFYGRVVSLEYWREDQYQLGIHVTFEVAGLWKGTVASTVGVNTLALEPTCGFPFAIHGDYLVYAYRDPVGERLWTGAGSRTTGDYYQAIEDRMELGPGRTPEPAARPLPWETDSAAGLPSWAIGLIGAAGGVLIAGLGFAAISRRRARQT